jgi:hypothetical protein
MAGRHAPLSKFLLRHLRTTVNVESNLSQSLRGLTTLPSARPPIIHSTVSSVFVSRSDYSRILFGGQGFKRIQHRAYSGTLSSPPGGPAGMIYSTKYIKRFNVGCLYFRLFGCYLLLMWWQ